MAVWCRRKHRGTLRLRAHFEFNPVGQGLFYSGRVGNLDFVYDCGSFSPSYLNGAISRYKSALPASHLDLLVLSHLDFDHTSGVKKLVDGLKVEFAVLPYLLPAERLIIAAKNATREQSYLNFLVNPVSSLVEYGVRTVVLIGRGRSTNQNEGGNSREITILTVRTTIRLKTWTDPHSMTSS